MVDELEQFGISHRAEIDDAFPASVHARKDSAFIPTSFHSSFSDACQTVIVRNVRWVRGQNVTGILTVKSDTLLPLLVSQ